MTSERIENKRDKTVKGICMFTAGLAVGSFGVYALLRACETDQDERVIRSEPVRRAKRELKEALSV